MCHVHVFTVFYRYLQHHLESLFDMKCLLLDFQYHIKIITLDTKVGSCMDFLHRMTTSYNTVFPE